MLSHLREPVKRKARPGQDRPQGLVLPEAEGAPPGVRCLALPLLEREQHQPAGAGSYRHPRKPRRPRGGLLFSRSRAHSFSGRQVPASWREAILLQAAFRFFGDGHFDAAGCRRWVQTSLAEAFLVSWPECLFYFDAFQLSTHDRKQSHHFPGHFGGDSAIVLRRNLFRTPEPKDEHARVLLEPHGDPVRAAGMPGSSRWLSYLQLAGPSLLRSPKGVHSVWISRSHRPCIHSWRTCSTRTIIAASFAEARVGKGGRVSGPVLTKMMFFRGPPRSGGRGG